MRSLLLAVVLVLAIATGALAAPPKEARFTLDAVEYLYIAGVNRTGTATLNGGAPMPIDSCAFVMLHPGTPNGRVIVHGAQGFTAFDLYVDQLRLDNGKRGYAYDKPVSEDGLAAVADVAVQGNATLRILGERYYDPVSSSGDALIDKDQPQMRGAVVSLPAGVRGDADGQVLSTPQKGDEELHVHMRSSPEAAGRDIVFPFSSSNPAVTQVDDPAGVPPGTVPQVPPGTVPILPTEAYSDAFVFDNLKLGGMGTLAMEAQAYAAAGQNQLTFAVVSPMGDRVAEFSLAPAMGAADSASATFPLDLMGKYMVFITGQANMATYSGSVTLQAPEAVDLHLWYENVTYGEQAYNDYRACTDRIGSTNEVVGVESVIGQPIPPRFDPWLAVVAVVAAIVGVTVVVKLGVDQVAASSFRKGK